MAMSTGYKGNFITNSENTISNDESKNLIIFTSCTVHLQTTAVTIPSKIYNRWCSTSNKNNEKNKGPKHINFTPPSKKKPGTTQGQPQQQQRRGKITSSPSSPRPIRPITILFCNNISIILIVNSSTSSFSLGKVAPYRVTDSHHQVQGQHKRNR